MLLQSAATVLPLGEAESIRVADLDGDGFDDFVVNVKGRGETHDLFVAIMDGVGEALWQDPRTVLLWTAAAFIANPVLQGLGAAFFAASGRKAGVTLGLLSGNRNMGLVLASLPPGADESIVLFFALAQIPMYTLPALLRPLYRAIL